MYAARGARDGPRNGGRPIHPTAHFGVEVPWLYFALFAIVLSAALSHLDVQLSAAVLGVALLLEVLGLVWGFVPRPTG